MKLRSLLLFVMLAGCQHVGKHIDDPTSQLTGPVTAARAEIIAAKVAVKIKDFIAAVPHLDAALLQLTAEDAVIADVAKASVETQTQLAKVQDDVAKHKNDWLGPRAHRWIWGMAITAVVLALGFGALSIFAPGSMFLSVVYHGLLGVVSFGMSWAHAVGAWVGGKFHKTSTPIR